MIPGGPLCVPSWTGLTNSGAGEWTTLPFLHARARLATALRRNLSRWAGVEPTVVTQYRAGLTAPKGAAGPVVMRLRNHVLELVTVGPAECRSDLETLAAIRMTRHQCKAMLREPHT
jgi:hypothetical protein